MRRYGSLAHGRQAGRNGNPMPDAEIDFSDIPQSTDQELRGARGLDVQGAAMRSCS